MSTRRRPEFQSTLFTIPGKGGWTFARIPERYAPSGRRAWGRTPVRATVDGQPWSTSVWRNKSGETLLPIPKHVRGTKRHGDRVRIQIDFAL